jgi:hypothetical protein
MKKIYLIFIVSGAFVFAGFILFTRLSFAQGICTGAHPSCGGGPCWCSRSFTVADGCKAGTTPPTCETEYINVSAPCMQFPFCHAFYQGQLCVEQDGECVDGPAAPVSGECCGAGGEPVEEDCGDSQYPQCKNGICGAGKSCKQGTIDGEWTCKCLRDNNNNRSAKGDCWTWDCGVSGWACDADSYSTSTYVTVHDRIADTWHGRYFAGGPGGAANCNDNDNHGFNIDLSGILPLGNNDIDVYAFEVDEGGFVDFTDSQKICTHTLFCSNSGAPPTCEVTGPLVVPVGVAATYTGEGYDSDGNVTRTSLHWSPTSAASPGLWTAICDEFDSSCSDSVTWDTEGTYYVHATARDDSGRSSSGNPYCSSYPCFGFYDCALANKYITVSVEQIGYCEISASAVSMDVGTTIPVPFSKDTELNGEIDEVRFTVADSSKATVCNVLDGSCSPGGGGAQTYIDGNRLDGLGAIITAHSPGGTTLSVTAYMNDDPGTPPPIACNEGVPVSVPVDIANANPWWQTVGGDTIAAGGNITSAIPSTCTPSVASCQPYLHLGDILDLVDAGMSITTGVINTGSGSSGSEEVEGTGAFLGSTYDYQYFLDRANAIGATLNGTSLAQIASGGGAKTQGYSVFSGGSLSIPSDITISDGAKSVVFVNGDLLIDGKVQFSNEGNTFLMFIVSGNIVVNPSVGSPYQQTDSLTSYDLEGIYLTDGQFETGTNSLVVDSDFQLTVRGSVVGLGNGGTVNGMNFERSLPNNASYPAEVFVFAPDQILLYPAFLSPKPIRWREIAP